MADDPTVSVSPLSGGLVGVATTVLSGINVVMAVFLLEDLFGLGLDEDLRAELIGIRNGAVGVMTRVYEAFPSEEELDLDLMASASLEAAGAALSLTFRCLDLVRRTEPGPGPWAAKRLDQVEETLQAIAEFLPVGWPPMWNR
jgi:hypothetical protein